MTPEERFDRIERALQAAASSTQATAANLEDLRANVDATAANLEDLRANVDEFRALVRGAFTVQQEEITELRKTTETLVREWQAYLRTIHPPQ